MAGSIGVDEGAILRLVMPLQVLARVEIVAMDVVSRRAGVRSGGG